MDEQGERLDHPGRRVWLTALVAIVALGVAGAAATFATYRSERDAAVDELERIAVQSLVDATQYAQGRVDVLRVVAGRRSISEGEADAVREALAEVPAAALGFDGGLVWFGDDGTVALGAGPWATEPVVSAVVAEVRTTGSPQLSSAAPRPVAPDSVVVVVVPTIDAAGDSNGALAGAISVAALRRVTDNVSTLREADVFLIDRAGRTIAGRSGTDLVDVATEVVADAAAVASGASMGTSSSASANDPAGRSDRVVGVAAEPEMTGWTIVASRSQHVAFADARRQIVQLLAAIAVLAAVGVVLAFAVGRRLDRATQRLSATLGRERAVAIELQRHLLPARLPEIDGIELAARYEPAGDAMAVGGDWYDVTVDAKGRTCLFVGDVTGHGVHAAGVMGQMRAAMHALAASSTTLAEVIDGLDAFAADLPTSELATLVMAAVELLDDSVVVGRIGHPPPLRIAADGSTELLWSVSSPPVGVPAERLTSRHRFAPGDTILLYTDGLIERRGSALDDQLELLRTTCERLAGGTVSELVDGVVEVFGSSEDDVALVAARRQGANP